MKGYYYKLEIEIVDDELYSESDLEDYVKDALEVHLECLIAKAKFIEMSRCLVSELDEVAEA